MRSAIKTRQSPRGRWSIGLLAVASLFVLSHARAADDNPEDAAPSLAQRADALKAIQKAMSSKAPGDPKWLYNHVNLNSGKVSADLLAKLTALPEIERLSLSQSDVTDAALHSLKQLPELRYLDLSDTAITNAGLAQLALLPQLESLLLARTRITGAGLAALTKLKNLEGLELGGTAIQDAGLQHVAALPKLSFLDLSGTKIGDLGLHYLRKSTNIGSLNLTGTLVTDAGLTDLQGMPKLAGLNLGGTPVGDIGIKALGHLASLVELRLSKTQVGDASMATIGQWTELRSLDLAGTAVTDRGVKSLSRLKQLVRLRLSDTRITDLALPVVRRFDRLQSLGLANTAVTNSGLTQLESLPSLSSIDVQGTKITAFDVFRALPRMNPNIKKILAALGENTELDFENQSLDNVVDYLKTRHDIEIQFSYRSLADANISTSTPITARHVGITLREALEGVLEPLGLTMAVRHEVLLIAAQPLPDAVSDLPVVPSGERLSPRLAETIMQPSSLDFAEQPLADVVEYLVRKHQIDLQLDDESLLKAGIGSDAPVTRSVKGITLKSALELVLDDLDLTCVAEGEGLVIRAKAEKP
jgi:Leucine-rich repeat (LRR) protein